MRLTLPVIVGVLLSVGSNAQTPQQATSQEPSQTPSQAPAEVPAAVPAWTTAQDHQHMLDLLGIKQLRPGADGRNPSAPNSVNYDESRASLYSAPADPLRASEKRTTRTSAEWWRSRRPELEKILDREIYGRMPKRVPTVEWKLLESQEEIQDGIRVRRKELVGVVDNRGYPAVQVGIRMQLTVPVTKASASPVIMELGFIGPNPFAPPGAGRPDWHRMVLERGWAVAIIDPRSIQADNGAGLRLGIIGITAKGELRGPEDWGVLRAWAWGASRALDYFEADRDVDATRVAVEGLSRYGKAALVAMAYDRRFALGLIGSSGAGGAKLLRRDFGERVENLAAAIEYHWMAGNFLKYAGPLTTGDLPVDAQHLIALCAPRPLFIGAGAQEGDGWVDPHGSFLAAVAASPVYELLGAQGLSGVPYPDTGVVAGEGALAFRRHAGGHTAEPNWPAYLQFAQRHFAVHAP